MNFYYLKKLLPSYTLEQKYETDVDKMELKRTFSSFGFKIVIRENLTHTEMLSAVEDIVHEGASYDSVVVCILSHGFNGMYIQLYNIYLISCH